MHQNNYVAIMAGGVGSRFWPMSRTKYPKQFLDILDTGKTLLQSTYQRYLRFIPNEHIFIITSEEYVEIVRKQLPNLPEANIIGEPERKNTAPCIALISMKLKQLNPDANLIVAPSDHLIGNEKQFMQHCLSALNFTANNQAFVTLGIKPTYANTGYGYIHFDNSAPDPGICNVIKFIEKPDQEWANVFFESGSFLWNAGIFIWKVHDLLEAFKLHMPDMYQAFLHASSAFGTTKEKEAIADVYQNCESISIDYAILEKSNNVFVIPASFGWSDLGTWNSAWENFEKDEAQNAIAGNNTMVVNASGCMVHSTEQKLVLVGGVDNLIIVNTPDALLVCKKENEQQIKEYLQKVKMEKGALYL